MAPADIAIHPHVLPQLTLRGGVQVREDTIFTDAKGRERNGIRKAAEKGLEQLHEVLPRILATDEAVLWISRCETHASVFEKFTLGIYLYAVTATVLVFTNRRILEFRVKPKAFGGRTGWSWRHMIRAVAWGDIAEAKAKGWLGKTLTLRYRNGRNEVFWRLKGLDKRKMRALLEALHPASVGETTPAQGMVSLCPQCLAALTKKIYQCAQCGQRFKDERTATVRSLLIPGGGYFYTGNVALGLLDAWFEAILILLIVALGVELAGLYVPPPDEPPATWDMVVVLLVLLALEKTITILHSRKFVRDFIPQKA